MKRALLRNSFILMLGAAALIFNLTPLSADENSSPAAEIIDMVSGDIQMVHVNSLNRVSVTNPEIADISDAQGDKVSLLAKKAGETVLFLWDAGGKRIYRVRVVNENLTAVKRRIQRMLSEANIQGISLEENSDIGKVVISGDVTKDDKGRIDFLLQSDSDNILNLVKEEKSQALIQVDMQVVEISTTMEKNLGILWGTTSTSSGSSTTSNSATNSGSVGLNYGENLPSGDKFKDLFKIGNFQRSSPLEVTVNALIQEGKARLISKPRLVVESGKQASFLVGGEIPISTTTTNTTGSTLTQNTSYTQYGVNMTVTPTYHRGKIDILLNVDIRDIDSANSSNGNTAFITRTAQTELFMDNRQTVALAGLIKYTDSEQVTSVPFLSKVPVVGGLFRNRRTPSPDTNTEMVIILTPTVMNDEKLASTELVMPTTNENNSWKEIDSKYEHQSLVPPPPPAPEIPKEPVQKTMYVPESSPEPAPMSYNEITAYARMVQERISKSISYPKLAQNHLAGTVKLKLDIRKDGSLSFEEIMEPSGSKVLDQAALDAARSAAPFRAFTMGMKEQEMIFTIPIIFNKLISDGHKEPGKVIASY